MNTNDTNGTPENPTGLPGYSGPPAPAEDAPAMTADSSTSGGPANLRTGAVIPAAVDEDARKANPDYIQLQDGRWAYVKTQTGAIIPKARQIMQEDGENFTDCLAALSTTIEGRPIVIEDLYELPLKDTMRILARFNAKNGL